MGSATLGPGYSCTFIRFSAWRNPSSIPRSMQFVRYQQNKRNFLFKSLKCVHISHPSLADVKLRRLASEFTELTEPIDRVKRLLRYAALLPPFDESARVPANRVTGCTAEVWLDVSLDEFGGTRFAVDSDSEITKGFCSCLIWILDGAAPEEVLKVKADDLMEMNVGVGLGVRAHSRVNAWHSILTSMQKRTEALVAERERKAQPAMEIFSSLVVSADDKSPKPQTQNIDDGEFVCRLKHHIKIQKDCLELVSRMACASLSVVQTADHSRGSSAKLKHCVGVFPYLAANIAEFFQEMIIPTGNEFDEIQSRTQ